MSVRFILDRSGSGKSIKMVEEIRACLQRGSDERLFLLVPEQFTLQAERDLITGLNAAGIIRVEVLSFTRLARRVFEQVGGATRVLLNEQGRQMVLRKMIDDNSARLTIYKKAALQPGFVPRLGELLSELKGRDITAAQLRDSAAGREDMLVGQKVHDIALLYEEFEGYLQGRYLDADDHLNLLCEKITEADFLRTARIWVDGFSTLSPQSLKILARLMAVAREMTISLTLDPQGSSRDRELFSLVWRDLDKLWSLARQAGTEPQVVTVQPSPGMGPLNPAIRHLEQELFAYPSRPLDEDFRDVEIFAAANLSSEVEWAAAQVVELVRDRGWRYRDLAVICNDMETYGPLIKRVFAEYGIPAFMDRKRSLMENSIIKLVMSSLQIIRRGYRYEDVFAFLKTGFSGLTPDQVEILENFALRCGIQGGRWQQEFKADDPEMAATLDAGRLMLVEPLQELAEKIRGGRQTVAALCRAHYEYLVRIGLPERLETWIARMNELGRLDAAREHAQIWNLIGDIMDQMVEILGDQEADLKEYLHLLEAGFEAMEVGIIPTTIDQVLVGNVQRSKSQAIRGLLFLGVNDGVIPSAGVEEGILTEYEKETLQAQGLELGFDKNRRSAEERFLIYTALSKPHDYLGLSCAIADNEGRALRPSIIINRIRALLPGVKTTSDAVPHRELALHQIATPASTYKYLVDNLRSMADSEPVDPIWADVYRWYQSHSRWQPGLQETRAALFHRNQVEGIGSGLARRIYSLPLRSSVSRLEQYVNCPFAHFIRYGLRPQERKVYEVAAPDIGELFHSCLASLALELDHEQLDWMTLGRSDSDRIVDTVMDRLVPLQGEGIFTSSPRYQHLARRLKRISRRAAWELTRQLQQGEFQPRHFEVGFGPGQMFPAIEVELGDGRLMYLEGRIDRVDLLETGEGTFVKIIDYKSG
ncbi:MAG: PD-(D/E)XK nuclease family protein, partial [Syntrophomonadaceae bacterium]